MAMVVEYAAIVNLNTPHEFSHLATGETDGPEKKKKSKEHKGKKHKKRSLPDVMQMQRSN